MLEKYRKYTALTGVIAAVTFVVIAYWPMISDRVKFMESVQSNMTQGSNKTATETHATAYVQAQSLLPEVSIIDRPVKWTSHRNELAKEYAKIHYDRAMDSIVPQAIVVHWTATDDSESVYKYFYAEETTDAEHVAYGKLNVCSHFLIDRDGTIYRLTPETALNRHAIGWNWCAIGIENVGGVGDRQNLTERQLQANTKLIRYLKAKYDTIEYVLGHYQQDYGRDVGLWIEKFPDYYAEKPDPGPIFMKRLSENLADVKVKFFKP